MTPDERKELEELEARRRLDELRRADRRDRDNDELRAAIRAAVPPDSRWARVGLPPAGGPLPRPRRGRPAWTSGLFRARYEAAVREAQPLTSAVAIAIEFIRLDGTRGISEGQLRDLRRRYG